MSVTNVGAGVRIPAAHVEPELETPHLGLPPAVEALRPGHVTDFGTPLATRLESGEPTVAPLVEVRTPEGGAGEVVEYGSTPARVPLPEGWFFELYQLSGAVKEDRPNIDHVREFGLKMQRAGNAETANPELVLQRFMEAREAARPKPPPSVWEVARELRPSTTHAEYAELSAEIAKSPSADRKTFTEKFLRDLDKSLKDIESYGPKLDEAQATDGSFTAKLYRAGRANGLSPEAAAELRSAIYDTALAHKPAAVASENVPGTIKDYATEILRRPLHQPENREIKAREAGFILEARGLPKAQKSAGELNYPASAVYRAARELQLGHDVAMKVASSIHPADSETAKFQPRHYAATATMDLAGLRHS